MRHLWVLLGSLLVTGAAFAAEPDEVQALLQKIQNASSTVSYTGIFVYQHESQLNTSRIAHSFDGHVELEKIEKLDGRRLEFVRRNEEITRYQPDNRTLRVEKRQDQDMFPAVLAFNSPNLAEQYQFRLGDVARVAGVDCRVVLIEPRDNFRYGYRLCAAIPSNLMLTAQTTGPDHRVLEQIAFTALMIGPVNPASLTTSFTDLSEWKQVQSPVTASTDSGWRVKNLPAGFRRIREVRRLIGQHTPSSPGKGGPALHEVLQIVYSDGLASISLFIEPLGEEHQTGLVQQGATTILGFQLGQNWVTLVGEVPAAAIKQLADSIEYKPK